MSGAGKSGAGQGGPDVNGSRTDTSGPDAGSADTSRSDVGSADTSRSDMSATGTSGVGTSSTGVSGPGVSHPGVNAAGENMIPAVCLDDIWVRLGGSWVLEGVNLDIAPGEFVGIIGPNGAGKSVLLRTILGLIEPERGRVRVFGQSPHQLTGAIAYVPQFAAFDRGFPIRVLDVVLMGRLGRSGLAHRFTSQDHAEAMAALAEVQLAHRATRQIGRLSGGELQRVLIARALAVRAELILLDEPTASLDPPAAHALYDLLAALSQRMTVVLVSHDVGVMSEHVQTVVCLNRRILHRDVPGVPADVLRSVYGYDVHEVSHQHGVPPDRR